MEYWYPSPKSHLQRLSRVITPRNPCQPRTVSPPPYPVTSASVQGRALVEEFLRIIMIPDPLGARAFVAPEMRIRFTEGREMHDPADCSAFNTGRYAWVKKASNAPTL